jgi:hypothetical protein
MSDTLINLPAGARARRAEEKRRLALIEAKLDDHLRQGQEAAPAASPATPTPPKSPTDEALELLARNLGDDTWFLPTCCAISRDMDDEGMYATGFTVEDVFFPLRLAYEIGVMSLSGAINYNLLGPLIHDLKGRDPRSRPALRPEL